MSLQNKFKVVSVCSNSTSDLYDLDYLFQEFVGGGTANIGTD